MNIIYPPKFISIIFRMFVTMIKTYTYKVKPNKTLERKFEEWLGTCRFVYNVAKEVKEESYKLGVSLSNFDFHKQLTPAKEDNPWLYEVSSGTLIATLDRLDLGYKKFYSDLKKGKKTSIPKWASKKKWRSIPFKSIKQTHNAFNLPKFGIVKVFNFKQPKGELRTANLVREADGLYLKIVVREPDVVKDRDSQSICAIDMGITYFLTTSDAEFVDNPKHLFKSLKELRVQQRKLSRMKKGGSNYKKQCNVIARLHQKVSRVRKDFLHKKSRQLANQYDFVIRENLNISGMAKNTKLSKHILDCAWGMFFELLEYKTEVIKVSPHYSSQECSKCGHTCKENRKTQSLFECIECGYAENADLQATYNLLKRGQTLLGANVVQ